MHLHDQTAGWFKSSYSSEQGGNCVEALRLTPGIAIRDSKDKSGPNLRFTAEAWQSLVAGIKAGELG
ncbi:DUF397 domain-containing protein [Kitasatospora sp. NPDC001159]